MTIRPARRDDVLAIQRIYNHEVLHSLATFDEAPWSTEHRLAWLEQQRGELVLVAVGERSVVGFAHLAPRARSAYRFTREATVYVDPAEYRGGVGRRLVEALIEGARARDLHVLLARIESGNAASIALFESLGFERAGLQREVGYKHGRWLDVVDLQLLLQPAAEIEARVEPGFRVAVVEDAAALQQALSVRRAVFIEEQGIAAGKEIDGYDGAATALGTARTPRTAVHVLGRLDGRPVATARLLLDQPAGEYPHIGRVAVLAELRGRYLGVAIMEALHQEARRRGQPGVTLASQEYATGFYARLGYVARGGIFLDAGIEHRWLDLVFEAGTA
ncbi:MAG: GNAT family N-acetyltransferase [Chloroflexi bacterium]|nr:GNAT family N-acetyltransferase [Chloroflexota bacterium]